MSKQKREELHRFWMEVTGTAVVALHRADGYKGRLQEEEGVSLIRPNLLAAKSQLLHLPSQNQLDRVA